MEWNYPEVSLEELSKIVKGFVNVLVLASGYQSSGLPASWDVLSIKRALQWSLFFEKLIRDMRSKDEYADSLILLEAELSLLKADPHFPLGLAHLSVETLTKAKELVITHLVQKLSLGREHLAYLLKAATEVDLDELRASDIDYLDTYLGELMLQSASYKCAAEERGIFRESITVSPEVSTDQLFKSCCDMDNLAAYTIEEILQRQNAVSFMSTVEIGLEAMSTFVKHNVLADLNSLREQHKHGSSSLFDEHEVEFSTWNKWRSKSLSYFLDKRTVRLVAGADMLFSVPNCEWTSILNTLSISKDTDGLQETIELLLLGCVADRWNSLLNYLMSLPYVSHSISKQYSEVHSLLTGPQPIPNIVDQKNKETSIMQYLAEVVGNKHHLLFSACPSLLAAAIPTWSPLFRLYVSEIEFQFKKELSSSRLCSCTADMAHTTCEFFLCLHMVNLPRRFGVCTRFMSADPSTQMTPKTSQNEYTSRWVRWD